MNLYKITYRYDIHDSDGGNIMDATAYVVAKNVNQAADEFATAKGSHRVIKEILLKAHQSDIGFHALLIADSETK